MMRAFCGRELQRSRSLSIPVGESSRAPDRSRLLSGKAQAGAGCAELSRRTIHHSRLPFRRRSSRARPKGQARTSPFLHYFESRFPPPLPEVRERACRANGAAIIAIVVVNSVALTWIIAPQKAPEVPEGEPREPCNTPSPATPRNTPNPATPRAAAPVWCARLARNTRKSGSWLASSPERGASRGPQIAGSSANKRLLQMKILFGTKSQLSAPFSTIFLYLGDRRNRGT